MSEENISQEFRLKKIDLKKIFFIEEIKQNELISNKHKEVWKILNYNEHSLTLTSTATGCASISTFASLVGILAGIPGIRNCMVFQE